MAIAIGSAAIIVGIIAYGMGKLSVHVQQDNQADRAGPEDPGLAWEPRKFELWSKAHEDEVEAERATAKLIPALSVASIAGVIALRQVDIVGKQGAILLIIGFALPILFSVANLHMRLIIYNERARRLRDAFDRGRPSHRPPYEGRMHWIARASSKAAAITYGAAFVLTVATLPAGSVNCADAREQKGFIQLFCSELMQTLADKE